MRLPHWLIVSGLIVSSWPLAALNVSSALRDLTKGKPLPESTIAELSKKNSINATYYELLEAFAVLRQGDVSNQEQINVAKTMLERAVLSFEDLRDPDNFSVAFTSDPKTLYRGRPHERVLAALLLGVIDMAQGRYDMATSSLRNAEFLGVRWQVIPYASTTPLVYASMLRAAHMLQASSVDQDRAKEGLYRSLRLNLLLEPLAKSVRLASRAQMRPNALAVRVAEVIFDAALGTALVLAPRNADVSGILNEAVTAAIQTLPTLKAKFEDIYKEVFLPLAENISRVEKNMTAADVEKEALTHVEAELRKLAFVTQIVIAQNPLHRVDVDRALQLTKQYAQEITQAATAPQMVIRFSGQGPQIVREGQYNEITSIVPLEPYHQPIIEERSVIVETGCGFHRGAHGSLVVVLCGSDKGDLPDDARSANAVRVWSSTYQATSVMGREFNKVLKGRAQFRATTETIAAVGGITALALLQVGSQGYAACTGANAQACRTANQATMAAGAIVGALSGISYLVGRATNPEADPRYIPTLFEYGDIVVQR